MFHILILLISLCDFYPASTPDDSFFKDFPVAEQLDDKWTGCTESPFSGGPDDLTIQLKHETIDPSDESLLSHPNLVTGIPDKISISQLPPESIPIAPPTDDERYFLTPEPAAIIVVAGLLLLFLLFGRCRSTY